MDEFSQYRQNYFDHNNYEILEKYLETSIAMSWKIVFDLKQFLPDVQSVSEIYGRFPTIYTEFKNHQDYIKNTEQVIDHIGKISRFLYLPPGYDYRKWD